MRSGFWALSIFVLVLDQWTKHLVEQFMDYHQSITLVPGVLWLTYVRNPGTAFGLLHSGGSFLAGIAVLAVSFIIIYWLRLRQRAEAPSLWLVCGLSLPLGGALGNLVDRLR